MEGVVQGIAPGAFQRLIHGVPRLSFAQRWAFAGFLARAAVVGEFGVIMRGRTLIKSRKDGLRPFPKRARVGTYASHPRAFARVAFSGSLRTGSIGALGRWPIRFGIGFSKARNGLSRGGAAR